MEECKGNAFCSALPEDLRARLCESCIKSSYAASTSLSIDMNHPVLVLQGVVLSTSGDKPVVALPAGMLLLTPHFTPESKLPMVFDGAEVSTMEAGMRYRCFSPVTAALFPNAAIDELLQDIRFSKAVLDNTLMQLYYVQTYQAALYHGTAYDAVHFILKLAHAYGVERLTHEQIASLTGRNRTTVTKAMHEVALAEPELLEGFK